MLLACSLEDHPAQTTSLSCPVTKSATKPAEPTAIAWFQFCEGNYDEATYQFELGTGGPRRTSLRRGYSMVTYPNPNPKEPYDEKGWFTGYWITDTLLDGVLCFEPMYARYVDPWPSVLRYYALDNDPFGRESHKNSVRWIEGSLAGEHRLPRAITWEIES